MAGERCTNKDCCEYRSELTRLCMDDGWCTFQEWTDEEKPLNIRTKDEKNE